MSFKYNATGVEMKPSYSVAPEGVYDLAIKGAMEKTTKNGDPMVSVRCEIDEPGEWLGTVVWHNVTFLPSGKKGAGMALQFLKAIGQPYEGQFDVRSEQWVNCRFRAKLRVGKDLKSIPRNEIAYVIDDNVPPTEEEVPF